ncbi:nucleoside-diphosphate-sugar epimerase [Paraburkholderia sp. WSM4179]|nr:nucleoside-diphosphate-sugar epimerase [Paraburkholderia sp. WSM4179]
MQATGKVGLFGAAGAAGQSIATALGAAGRDYRVVGRSRDVLQRTFGDDPHAEIVTWNPDDPASIRAAAAGLQTVIYLVGVPYDQFAQHPPLMEKTLAGVTAAGVERFILIGTVYPYGRARGNPVREDHPREPHTFKGRMRLEQEKLVLAAHGQKGLETLVLRLPDFYGPGVERSLLHGVFVGAATGKRAQVPGQSHEKLFTRNGLRMGVVNCCEEALTLGFAKSREWCGRRIRAVEFARRVWGPEGSACTHPGA